MEKFSLGIESIILSMLMSQKLFGSLILPATTPERVFHKVNNHQALTITNATPRS